MYKYYKVITYGCQMNVHESEKLCGILEQNGLSSVDDSEKADVIIFNTCAIRKGAEDRAFGNIGALKSLKKEKPHLIIAVCGCMTQKEQTANELYSTFPFVDIIFGTHNVYKFGEYLNQKINNKKRILDIWKKEKDINEENCPISRCKVPNAFVNIMQGCNNFCSYCIVPYVRGRERSRNMDSIVKEVKSLIDDGFKTITLLGQNVNSYGNDIDDDTTNFANLLKTLASLSGDFRLKFMTSHPKDLSDEVIEVIAKNEKISKAIHLPVQSGSNKILNDMNRKYTVEKYLSIVENICKTIPDATISSDFIVGFPGETEEDFQQTCNLVQKVEFSQIFAYIYSRRSGTVADKMPNQIPYNEKNRRVNVLLDLQKQITSKSDANLVKKSKICFVSKEKNSFVATTDSNKKIHLDTCPVESLNCYKIVTITKFTDGKLFGQIEV